MKFLDNLKRRMTVPGAEAFEEERFRASKPGYLKGELPPEEEQTTDAAPPILFDAAAAARRRHWAIMFGAILLGVLVTSTVGSYIAIRSYRALRTVTKEQVQLGLNGPERVVSGEEVTLRLKLQNASRVVWENVVVEFVTPEGFGLKSASPLPLTPSLGGPTAADPSHKTQLTWSVGRLPPRASADFTVSGRLYGEEGGTALFTAKARLTPATQPGSPLERTLLSSVALAGIPVDLTIDLPLRAPNGTPVTVRVGYQNRTAKDLQQSRLTLDVPQGFTVNSTTPPVRGRELQWALPSFPPQGQGEVTVVGLIEGPPDSVKPFVARIGFLTPTGQFLVQRQIQRSITMARTALSLTQVMNGQEDILKVEPGTEVGGVVRYQNTGTAGLREVIVRLTFEGSGYEVGSIRVDGGFFDSRRKEITWTAASNPALRAIRPGETGDLGFQFRVFPIEALPFAGPDDRNFTVITQAVGDSQDLPVPPGAPKQVPTDRFSVLVNTVPNMVVDAFYDDGRSGLPPSTGPLPPTVEKETILAVRARVGNTSNEIVDAVYSTVLPEGVRWVGKEYHTTGDVSYNERTHDLIWKIPLIAAHAGKALPGPELAYQVALIPSLNQIDQVLALTKGHTVEGTDAYTTVHVRAEAPAVSMANVDSQRARVVR